MPGVTETGTLKYNGYTFEGASSVRVRMTVEYDEAGRTAIAQRYSITVVAIVVDDNGLDSDLEDIRARLSEAGKKFEFTDRGFGDDIVVSAANRKDIDKGPKPRILAWVPIGDDKAAEIEWQVDIALASCGPGGKPRRTGITALNYGVNYEIDIHGDTTRTINGYLTIAQAIQNGRSADTADRYREKFQTPALQGFKRTQSYRTSPDRSRLDFTITDRQIPSPNAYPRDVTDINASHRFSLRRGTRGYTKSHTISATFTLPAGVSGARAWLQFAKLVGDKLAWGANQGQKFFIEQIDIEEQLYARTHSFSVSYRQLTTPTRLLADTGLFQAVVGDRWGDWVRSLQGTSFNFRGHAQLKDSAAQDIVVSLCSYSDTVYVDQDLNVVPTQGPSFYGRQLSNNLPDPKRSYRRFNHYIVPSTETETTKHRVMQDPSSDSTGWKLEENQSPPETFRLPATSSEREPDAVQQDTSLSVTIEYIGEAERVGYPVPRPKIESIGGLVAHEVSGRFLSANPEDVAGMPLHKAAWHLVYELEGVPGTLDPPRDWS